MKELIGYKETSEGVLTITEDSEEIMAGSTTNCGIIPHYKKKIRNFNNRQKCLEALIDEIENNE